MPGSRTETRAAFVSFFAIIGALTLPSLFLGAAALPIGVVRVLNVLLPLLYLGVPILAIYRVASADWTRKLALFFFLGGLAAWGGFFLLEGPAYRASPFLANLSVALSQVGIQTFCVGLGAFLATMLRDKNLLIPIAIFLAVYDVFLVRTNIGPTHQLIVHAPAILKSTAVRIPAASTHHGNGIVAANAYVGDADVVSLAAFFVALFRFRLRTRETFLFMLPTLIAYLLIVIRFDIELPALLPIGAVILLVNYREFKLSKDEKLGTAIIACLACGLLTWGLTRPNSEPEPQPGHGPSVGVPGPPGSAQTPAPGAPGSPPSESPSAPAGK